jgi:hypothetical protein
MIPASPEDIQIPVPPSGIVTPMPGGIGSPKNGAVTPETGSGTKTPENNDELAIRIHDVV